MDIFVKFKSDPMFAMEFMDIHDSFPFWRKIMIRIRFVFKKSLGI